MTDDFIDVDLFAGGGGVSEGLRLTTGRGPHIAINHSADAIACHAINHPETEHYISDVYAVDPLTACRGRRVRALWLSPDCKHHSKAKGGKPLDRNIRDLAWIAFKWIEGLPEGQRPIVVGLENVSEFQDWGPLDENDRPTPERKGEIFRAFVARFRANGYDVQWKVLCCADHNCPTIRKRLVLQARRDGRPIVWPKPRNAKNPMFGERPWRTAAECIDWSLACPSIFLSKDEARAIRVKRPLAENTLARIARGVQRYVIDAANPFIVPITHHGDARVHPIDEPLRTVTAANRGEHALVTPFVAQLSHGESGSRRVHDPSKEPLGAVSAGGGQFGVVTPFITKFRANSVGQPMTEPLHTVTANSFVKRGGGAPPMALVAPHLMTMRNAGKPFNGADEPAHTVTAGGAHLNLVAAFLAQHNSGMVGHSADEPVSTVTQAGSHQQVVAAHLLSMKGSDRRDQDMRDPAPAICAQGGHAAAVYAFMVKYYGAAVGQGAQEPMHAVTVKPRFGLVTVHIAGVPYVIYDIGMRMLTPRELFRAQSFGDHYVIDRRPDGTPIPKTTQIARAGNAVPPEFAADIWRAMLGEEACLPIEQERLAA